MKEKLESEYSDFLHNDISVMIDHIFYSGPKDYNRVEITRL